MFLGFCNFYRRFIKHYSKIIHPLTDYLRGGQNGKKPGSILLGDAATKAFDQLKQAFMTAPILSHYDPAAPLRVETDASAFALAGILSQLQEHGGQKEWHPIAFHSRKLIPAEQRYETHDQELLAIVDSFQHWRHYLEGAPQVIQVLTDHNNLKGWRNVTTLTKRQARWAVKMEAYDWVIEYRPGKTNPADAPSRRPDYAGGEQEADHLLPTLQKKIMAWDRAESVMVRRVTATARSALHNEVTTVSPDTYSGRTISLSRIAVIRALSGEQPYEQPSKDIEELVRGI